MAESCNPGAYLRTLNVRISVIDSIGPRCALCDSIATLRLWKFAGGDCNAKGLYGDTIECDRIFGAYSVCLSELFHSREILHTISARAAVLIAARGEAAN